MRLDAAAAVAGLDSLELLHALEVIVAVDGHGVDQLLADQLADALGALLAVLLGLLHSHDLPVLEGDLGADLAAVGGRLVKLLVKLKILRCIYMSNNIFHHYFNALSNVHLSAMMSDNR